MIDADGTNLTSVPNLVVEGDSTDQIDHPSWSPDGTRIAFSSLADGYWHVYTIGVDGTNRTDVTGDWYAWCCHEHPEWSPDSSQIVFDNGRIVTIDTDGTNAIQFGEGYYPDWSPDGDKIAFGRHDGSYYYIHTMNVDGSTLTQLTRGEFPSWSPDGTQIVFARNRIGWPCCKAAYDIFVIDADGSNLTQITNYPDGAIDWFPDWSP